MINQYNSSISFNGLSRNLSKKIYNVDSIQKFATIYPKSQSIVGNLPADWIKSMPKENKSDNIKNLYFELGLLISFKRICSRNNLLFDKLLTKILKKHHAISDTAKLKVKKVDKGAFGQGFKIENSENNKPLFIKLFYKTSDKFYMHGSTAEANNKIYIKKHLPTKKQMHFSKFHYADIKNKYYIEEYLPEQNRLDPSTIDYKTRKNSIIEIQKSLYDINLGHEDLNIHNYYIYKKNGKLTAKCFDLGGIYQINKDSKTKEDINHYYCTNNPSLI